MWAWDVAANFYGAAVTQPVAVRWSTSGATRTLTVKIPSLPSELYFARLRAPDGRTGYAPFVLRASPLGSARVAIFLPTNTWEAYNFRDMNHDGVGDTWYADASIHTVDLTRPYLRGGMPPRFRSYDLGFRHWFATSVGSFRASRLAPKRADFYADDDFVRFPSGTGSRPTMTWSSSPVTRSTSRNARTTSPGRIETTVATSHSCPRTTSSTRS